MNWIESLKPNDSYLSYQYSYLFGDIISLITVKKVTKHHITTNIGKFRIKDRTRLHGDGYLPLPATPEQIESYKNKTLKV